MSWLAPSNSEAVFSSKNDEFFNSSVGVRSFDMPKLNKQNGSKFHQKV